MEVLRLSRCHGSDGGTSVRGSDAVSYRHRDDVRTKAITKRALLTLPDTFWMSAAQLVLVLSILLIALTPVTQSIWSGDNFLQGHDDTEFSLFLGFTLVSLFLLLCKSKQGDIKELLCRLKGWLVFLLRVLWDEGCSLTVGALLTASTYSRTQTCEAGSFNLPLLI
jgi:hypothetical protein